MSVIGIFQQLEWPNVRCAATWGVGHHHRCSPFLAISVHRFILGCELGDEVETQTKAFGLVIVAC
jgi:hypothetical protein